MDFVKLNKFCYEVFFEERIKICSIIYDDQLESWQVSDLNNNDYALDFTDLFELAAKVYELDNSEDE